MNYFEHTLLCSNLAFDFYLAKLHLLVRVFSVFVLIYLIAEWSRLIEIGQDREEKDWRRKI